MTDDLSRRAFLRIAAAGVGLAAVGGCSSSATPGADAVTPGDAGANDLEQMPPDGSADASEAAWFGQVIDTHCHLNGAPAQFAPSLKDAIAQTGILGIGTALLMPEPMPVGFANQYDADELLAAIAKSTNPQRFKILAGGGSLNVQIQEAIAAGYLTSSQDGQFQTLRAKFQATAEAILQKGAVGFGEMTCEHFSLNPDHPYVSAAPNHPLFLLLAEIAATNDVPIDIHMEAVSGTQPWPMPDPLRAFNNPDQVQPNIAKFEQLLSHNGGKHKIIWVHLGFDNTNLRTPSLTGTLMATHPNLYLSIEVIDRHKSANLLLQDGVIKNDWSQLITSHKERILLGSDHFYRPENSNTVLPESVATSVGLLSLLPAEVVPAVAYLNAKALFKLN